MLDMGFLDEIKEIFEYIPQNRQTLLFSATMPEPIKELANKILYEPKYISVIGEEETTKNDIKQYYYVINENQRDDTIVKLLEIEDVNKCIIFCRMKKEVDRLTDHLSALGFSVAGLHGDLEQSDRENIIKAYRKSQIKIMIATDVASRGLDVKNVTHVFNYHIPFDPQSYVHRIGRTGRAGKEGKAITLVSTQEFRELKRIQKEVGASMELSTIGGKEDISSDDIAYLTDVISNIEIDSRAIDVLDGLQVDDYKELALKFISLMLELESDNIGSQIGYDSSKVKQMINQFESNQKATKSNNRRKKRR